MQISPFRIEQYFGKYEFSAKYLLSSSDAESQSIADLLALEPSAHDQLLSQRCGYTESPGSPELRDSISYIYKQIRLENVLVVAAAEEAIFLFYHALIGPADHVIVETPCYESALTVAKSTGAAVSEWRRHSSNAWAHDLAALEALLQPNTRAIYINTPHNPTGLLMPLNVFTRVLELASRAGIYVFSDEVYRELEHDPLTRLPAACDLYERAVSLGSVSKTYGLPGLRLGWLASRDPLLLEKCLEFKYYTTICSSAPSEFLSALALRHREKLAGRNRQIVLRNLPILHDFLARHSNLFSWTPPNASPIGFVRFHPHSASEIPSPQNSAPQNQGSVLDFCETLVRESGVLLLPGSVYDQPGHIRFGFGRRNMPESLTQLESYLSRHSRAASM
jgi:aspartate/methionine/tyrosine aminotransferase